MTTTKRKSAALIALIIVVTVLVLVGLFGTLSLLQNVKSYQAGLDTNTTTSTLTKPAANRLVIAHTNVPVAVTDFQLSLLVTTITLNDQELAQVKIDVTDQVTGVTSSLEYNQVNQVQTVGEYQLRLVSGSSSAVQIVITKL